MYYLREKTFLFDYCDFIKYAINILCQDTCEPICFKHGVNLDTTDDDDVHSRSEGHGKARPCASHSVVKLHEATQMFMMVDCGRDILRINNNNDNNHMQSIMCQVQRRDSLAIKYDRVENRIYFSFVLLTEPLTNEGVGGVGGGGGRRGNQSTKQKTLTMGFRETEEILYDKYGLFEYFLFLYFILLQFRNPAS